MSAIIIKNNLIKKNIKISIDGYSYYAQSGESITYMACNDTAKLKISVDKKVSEMNKA